MEKRKKSIVKMGQGHKWGDYNMVNILRGTNLIHSLIKASKHLKWVKFKKL